MDKDRLNRIKRIEAIQAYEKEKRQQLLVRTYKEVVSRNGLALAKLAKE